MTQLGMHTSYAGKSALGAQVVPLGHELGLPSQTT